MRSRTQKENMPEYQNADRIGYVTRSDSLDAIRAAQGGPEGSSSAAKHSTGNAKTKKEGTLTRFVQSVQGGSSSRQKTPLDESALGDTKSVQNPKNLLAGNDIPMITESSTSSKGTKGKALNLKELDKEIEGLEREILDLKRNADVMERMAKERYDNDKQGTGWHQSTSEAQILAYVEDEYRKRVEQCKNMRDREAECISQVEQLKLLRDEKSNLLNKLFSRRSKD